MPGGVIVMWYEYMGYILTDWGTIILIVVIAMFVGAIIGYILAQQSELHLKSTKEK